MTYEKRMGLRETYIGRTVRVIAPEGSDIYKTDHPKENRKIRYNDEFIIQGTVANKIAHYCNGWPTRFNEKDVIIINLHDDKLNEAKKLIGQKIIVVEGNTHGHHPTEDRLIKIGDILHVCDVVQWANGQVSLAYMVSSKWGKNPHWGKPNQQSIGLKKVKLFETNTPLEDFQKLYVGKKIRVMEQEAKSIDDFERTFTQAHPIEDRKIRAGDVLDIIAVGYTRYNVPVLGYAVPNGDVYSEIFGWGMQQLYIKCASLEAPFTETKPAAILENLRINNLSIPYPEIAVSQAVAISEGVPVTKPAWIPSIDEVALLYCHRKVRVISPPYGRMHPTKDRFLLDGDILDIVQVATGFSANEFNLLYKTDPKFRCIFKNLRDHQAISHNRVELLGLMDDYQKAIDKYLGKKCVFIGSSACSVLHPTEDRYLQKGDVVDIDHVGYNPYGYLLLGITNKKHQGLFGKGVCPLNADLFRVYDAEAEAQAIKDAIDSNLIEISDPKQSKNNTGLLVKLGRFLYKALS